MPAYDTYQDPETGCLEQIKAGSCLGNDYHVGEQVDHALKDGAYIGMYAAVIIKEGKLKAVVETKDLKNFELQEGSIWDKWGGPLSLQDVKEDLKQQVSERNPVVQAINALHQDINEALKKDQV